jgi:hypothetical protein
MQTRYHCLVIVYFYLHYSHAHKCTHTLSTASGQLTVDFPTYRNCRYSPQVCFIFLIFELTDNGSLSGINGFNHETDCEFELKNDRSNTLQ